MKKITKIIAAALAASVTASFAAMPASARTIPLNGDRDRDGYVTSSDALSVLRLSAGIGKVSNVTFKRADVDSDGEITGNDALLILRESVGLGELNSSGEEQTYTVSDGMNDFSAELFSRTYESGKNTLVSPLSVYTALAMTTNGTKGDTQQELLKALGGEIGMDDINGYIRSYMETANGGDILGMANSIFVMQKNDISIRQDFSDTIKKDYFAEIFCEPANNATVKKINGWVSDNTKGMIPSILSENSLTPDMAAVLLNAVSFKAEWQEQYKKKDIKQETFRCYDGSEKETDFLIGEESCYLSDDNAVGFMKSYSRSSGKEDYRFIAILPDEDIGIDEYIANMDDSTISELVDSRTYSTIETKIPKFGFDCTYSLENQLKAMGIVSAFGGNADLSGMFDSYNTAISEVIHKTHIKLDENGTEAAAVTEISIKVTAIMPREPLERIVLDRPFIFVIYDMNNSVPIFIGTVCDIK